jgi:predicted alpha/beta-fold hydrolase
VAARKREVLGGSRLGLAENEVLDFQYTRALGYAAYGAASVGGVSSSRRGRRRGGSAEAWPRRRSRRVTRRSRAPYCCGPTITSGWRSSTSTGRTLSSTGRCISRASLALTGRRGCSTFRWRGWRYPTRAASRCRATSSSAPDDESRLTVIVCGGDGHWEETYFVARVAEALARGMNAVVFRGPGQRGLLHRHPNLAIRPDYEVPVGRVVDWALARRDVDGERLALYGLSFGGVHRA